MILDHEYLLIQQSGGRLRAVALTAHSNLSRLVEQARTHRPQWVVAVDAEAAADHDWTGLPPECQLLVGEQALNEIASSADVDVVVSAIVGSAGLMSTWAAVSAGKTVALANKEGH